jgi:gluconate 2-dehydrogenase gamma chain
MEKMWEVTRRKFLGLLSATGLFQVSRPAAGPRSFGAAPRVAPGYKVLSPAQVATLEAMAEQIIPADQDPGAREAGVVHYIDNVLAGYQSEKLPLYAAGLEGTDETSRLLYGHNFAKLAFARQTAVLKSLEQGDAPGEIWRSYSSREFFAMLWGHVLEGFYGPPSEGGNRNYASWKMVGFPEHSGTL